MLSQSADGHFPINCAAAENLLETELFGYEKGAFTGAAGRKPGKFELAHRGTLFLDEIGELPLALQAKILRALEQKRFERVGGTVQLQVDVRVVAATNRNLKAAVAARQFREDLFFRLSVFPITIPPLRDRPDDIGMLATHFIERFCRDQNKKPMMLAPSAIEAMATYPWPGSASWNCIGRAVILTEGATIPHAPGLCSGRARRRRAWSQIDLRGLAEGPRRKREVERPQGSRALKEPEATVPGRPTSFRSDSRPLARSSGEYGLDATSDRLLSAGAAARQHVCEPCPGVATNSSRSGGGRHECRL
jgi:transcriptional regulator with GAF, ATPase, and Fis domain